MKTSDIIREYNNVFPIVPIADKSPKPAPGQLELFKVNQGLSNVPFPPVEGLPKHRVYPDYIRDIEDALLGEDETQKAIAIQGVILTALLIAKNRRYGNSALEPMAVFAKDISTRTRMGVRMDDKINRIANGANGEDGEDAYRDLAGYLLLLLAGGQTGAL